MPPLNHPLRLRPVLKDYLWGGERLGQMFGKPLADGAICAESWEVVDHPDGQSVVEKGPFAGKTLGELVSENPEQLFGGYERERGGHPERFPLLFKLLDAHKTLSVQVHPNDAQAARQDPPDLGKTEAWLVLAAEPGGKIYAGLKEGVGRDELAAAIEAGECDRCLHVLEPSVGDCVFIPAGTVHALGEGLVIAEIQQASNTTFRLFDWNRLDKDGQPRPLHIQESLAVADYTRGPVEPQTPEPLGDGWERLVECDKFLFDRCRSEAMRPTQLPLSNGPQIVCLIDGAGHLKGQGYDEPMTAGQTLLLPAACPPGEFAAEQTGAVLLSMRLPD
ncbi:type I phosphomannose isomerase catalytic subunit [Botrimarina sp.]|uniref:type I phosphomannose isomerase catalytic subunit n=1 Tax=Botrimarina sp. TaxID=2795802 RepID=UPI0032ED932D